jgi:hypothetical protein
MDLSEQEKIDVLAAAELLDGGDLSVLKKLIEMQRSYRAWKAEIEALKAEFEGVLPSELQTKFDELSRMCEGKIGELEEMRGKAEETIIKLDKQDDKHSESIKKLGSDLTEMGKAVKRGLDEVRNLIPEMPDAFDPTDILKRINEIEAKIPQIPDELKAEQIRDKLETLEGEARLRIEAINGLREELDELKKRSGGRAFFGGGFNVSALNIHMVDDEVVAGSGTAWTLAHLPSPASSLKLYARGQRLPLTTSYTISGTSITTVDSWSAGDLYADYRT